MKQQALMHLGVKGDNGVGQGGAGVPVQGLQVVGSQGVDVSLAAHPRKEGDLVCVPRPD